MLLLLLSGLVLGMPPVARALPGDVAPGTLVGGSWCPDARDGQITVADALIALRRALSLVPSIGCGLGDWTLDVAPGVSQPAPGGGSPLWTPTPDAAVNAADALLLLRAAVGLIRIQPTNPDFRAELGTAPTVPALGDIDVFPGDPFPDEFSGDLDCNLNGSFDGPAQTYLRAVVGLTAPVYVPFEVCLWMREDARTWDFDAPPFDDSQLPFPLHPFPGPEDVDGDGDGILANPPPRSPDACSVICPAGFSAPGVACADTESAGGNALIVGVGPVFPTPPVETTQKWSVVVDPFHRLGDGNFTDNIAPGPPSIRVRQCPPVAPDLVGRAGFAPVISPAAPSQSDDISFQFEVANIGDASTLTDFWVDLYVDFDGLFPPVPGPTGPFPPTSRACTQVVIPPGERFDPGESVSIQLSQFAPVGGDCTNPSGPLRLPPGLHDFRTLIDSVGVEPGNPPGTGGAISELDDGNNLFPESASSLEGKFCVGSGRGLGSPDLAITRVRFFERGTNQVACHRQAGDLVDVEVEFRNLDGLAQARDLGLSKGFQNFRYALKAQETTLDGFEFDCVPVGTLQAPLRGSYVRNLSDTTLRLELNPTPALPPLPAAPADVSPANNVTTAPLLNQPPVVSAGPDRNGAVGAPIALLGAASDPNDVPAGSQPLALAWSVTVKPAGSTTTLSDASAPKPVFTGNLPGRYTLRLEARDCGATGFVVSDTVHVDLVP